MQQMCVCKTNKSQLVQAPVEKLFIKLKCGFSPHQLKGFLLNHSVVFFCSSFSLLIYLFSFFINTPYSHRYLY